MGIKHKVCVNIAKPDGTPSPIVRSGTMQIRSGKGTDFACSASYVSPICKYDDLAERELALFMDIVLLGKCSERWVFGDDSKYNVHEHCSFDLIEFGHGHYMKKREVNTLFSVNSLKIEV